MKRTLLAVLALIVALLPGATAQAQEGQIRFINPSPYSETDIPEVSGEGGRPIHLVAWVRGVPSTPFVEFEIEPVEGPILPGGATTLDGERVGSSDTWEAQFAIPAGFNDGEYTLRARIFSGNEEVAATSQTVMLDHETPPPTAENVSFVSPANAGPLGFYTPPGKRPNAVVNVDTSDGTDQVRVLYTKSQPGTQPTWVQCGTGRPIAPSTVATVRCTLAEGDTALQVTAVSAAANNTPFPGPPQAAADDASDAVRVSPYLQIPTEVIFERDGYQVTENMCNDFRLFASDQFGLPIAAANVDLHAQGPTDQLRFATNDDTPVTTTNDAYQAPDKAHGSDERAYLCSNGRNAEESQGDHNLIGGSDRKHIESVDGTDNTGSFIFSLFSAVRGGTTVTAWIDGDDDDTQGASEAVGFGRIGWSEDPPAPPKQVVLDPDSSTASPGECIRVVMQARQGDSVLAGVNIDIHIQGPEDSVNFCIPIDQTPSRPPDAGGHEGSGAHDDGTKHLEGETDSNGQFIFGVFSPDEGQTDIGAWIDESEDDTFAPAEPSSSTSVFWGQGRPRKVKTRLTLRYRNGAFRGKVKSKVKGCTRGRRVTVKRKKSGTDPSIGSDRSGSKGIWKVQASANGRYYAKVRSKLFAGQNRTIRCKTDRSRTIRV